MEHIVFTTNDGETRLIWSPVTNLVRTVKWVAGEETVIVEQCFSTLPAKAKRALTSRMQSA